MTYKIKYKIAANLQFQQCAGADMWHSVALCLMTATAMPETSDSQRCDLQSRNKQLFHIVFENISRGINNAKF